MHFHLFTISLFSFFVLCVWKTIQNCSFATVFFTSLVLTASLFQEGFWFYRSYILHLKNFFELFNGTGDVVHFKASPTFPCKLFSFRVEASHILPYRYDAELSDIYCQLSLCYRLVLILTWLFHHSSSLFYASTYYKLEYTTALFKMSVKFALKSFMFASCNAELLSTSVRYTYSFQVTLFFSFLKLGSR